MRTKTILAMVVLLLSAMTLLTFSSAREKKVSQAAKVICSSCCQTINPLTYRKNFLIDARLSRK
jgi:hypothetical protein